MSPKREFRPHRRKSGFREFKLIVIATEGTHTEKQYFEAMASPEHYFNPRVHIEVLDRLTEASSPKHVLELLNAFKSEYALGKEDELWMVIDLDRWHNRELSSVAARCVQKNYKLAVSNPCFEFWLLLHFKSLDDYTDAELVEMAANRRVTKERTWLDKELVNVLGSYNKSAIEPARFLPFVDQAIIRAKVLDVSPEHRWPNTLGSRVYLLAESIKNR